MCPTLWRADGNLRREGREGAPDLRRRRERGPTAPKVGKRPAISGAKFAFSSLGRGRCAYHPRSPHFGPPPKRFRPSACRVLQIFVCPSFFPLRLFCARHSSGAAKSESSPESCEEGEGRTASGRRAVERAAVFLPCATLPTWSGAPSNVLVSHSGSETRSSAWSWRPRLRRCIRPRYELACGRPLRSGPRA